MAHRQYKKRQKLPFSEVLSLFLFLCLRPVGPGSREPVLFFPGKQCAGTSASDDIIQCLRVFSVRYDRIDPL